MKKLSIPIHPILFAISPVLALYAFNVSEVSPSEIVAPILISLGATALLLVLSWVVFKRLTKPAIAITVFLALFFSYGHALTILVGSTLEGRVWILLAVVWLALLAWGIYSLAKTRRDLSKASGVLNVVGLALIFIPMVTIVAHETGATANPHETGIGAGAQTLEGGNATALPDVYYIVPDRYASEDILDEFYSFDNSEFIDYLKDTGFHVQPDAFSNYPRTPSSLASSLNMSYVNYLTEVVPDDSMDLRPFYSMIEDNYVCSLLKSQGYTYVHIGPWWEGTRENRFADVSFSYCQLPEFSMLTLKTTLAYPFCAKAGLLDDERARHRNCAVYAFEKLAEIPEMEEPTFTFAHILLPHPPFVFDEDGGYVTAQEENERSREENYLSQLRYANSQFKALIDSILSQSEVPPIIIIQADEGPLPQGDLRWRAQGNALHIKYDEATDDQIRQKMGILNAYYLPNVDIPASCEPVSPVNTFRLVFNLFFDADLEILPDRYYAYAEGYPYRFFEVTDVVVPDTHQQP